MHRMCEITQKYCDAVMFEEKVSILRNLLKMGIAEDNACDCTAIPEAQRAEALALAKGDMVSATNYDAIIKMQPDHMEHFLDQVYLTGLNTGMYVATNDDDSVLDDNPFDATWLAAEAEKATALVVADDGDMYMLNALTEAVVRSVEASRREGANIKEIIFEIDDGDHPFSGAVVNGALVKCIRALMHTESISFEQAASKLGCTSEKITALRNTYGEQE